MSVMQWSPILAALISAAVSLLVGALGMALVKNRKQVQLETELEQTNATNESLLAAKAQLETAKTQLEADAHKGQLAHSQLTQQLDNVTANSQATEQRLNAEVLQTKQELTDTRARLEQVREQHNQAEIQLKASATDVQALREYQQELRTNLKDTQEKLEDRKSVV